MPKSMYRKGKMKKTTSKGNPRKVDATKMTGGNVRTGRRYGKGGKVTRKHD